MEYESRSRSRLSLLLATRTDKVGCRTQQRVANVACFKLLRRSESFNSPASALSLRCTATVRVRAYVRACLPSWRIYKRAQSPHRFLSCNCDCISFISTLLSEQFLNTTYYTFTVSSLHRFSIATNYGAAHGSLFRSLLLWLPLICLLSVSSCFCLPYYVTLQST